MSLGGEGFKTALTEDLVHGDCRGVGKIQTAKTGEHGDADRIVVMIFQKLFGKPCGLFAEDEIDGLGIFDLGVVFCRLGGKEVKGIVFMLLHKIGKIFVIGNVEFIPIIKSCALELGFGGSEAHRLDQVQSRACGGAGARDIACVLGDLGFNEYNVNVFQNRVSLSFDGAIVAQKCEFVK